MACEFCLNEHSVYDLRIWDNLRGQVFFFPSIMSREELVRDGQESFEHSSVSSEDDNEATLRSIASRKESETAQEIEADLETAAFEEYRLPVE